MRSGYPPDPDEPPARGAGARSRRRPARATGAAAGSFYTERLTDEERAALAQAATLSGVDAEIAVLRVLIRRVLTRGDLDAARRGIETLCRTLKLRHALDDQSSSHLSEALSHVLDAIAEDEAMAP